MEQREPKEIRESERIKSICIYVVDNIAADLHAISVAKKFRLSISSFHHLFTKYKGKTYRHFLEEIRMDTAAALLRVPGIRIKEVMYATGYKNRTTFNTAFKKRFTYPPGFFKK